MDRRLLFPLFVVALLGLAATSAVADVDEGTFDDDGFVSSDGRHVTTQVSVECDEGERYFIRLTITQDDTGALAQVKQPGECTGEEEDLALTAPARGRAVFDAGDETEACALVRTRMQSEITDAEQFCEDDINLDEDDDIDDV